MLLAAITVTFVGTGVADVSAATRVSSESRVRANAAPIEARVGAYDRVAADHDGRQRPAGYEFVSATGVATEEGLAGGPRAIVIGEDMEGRVIPTAKKLGAEYYNPPDAPPSEWMENNRQWINDRMDEGCTIYDCGAAPGRANYPDPTSPYYQMERDEIAKRGYPTIPIHGPR